MIREFTSSCGFKRCGAFTYFVVAMALFLCSSEAIAHEGHPEASSNSSGSVGDSSSFGSGSTSTGGGVSSFFSSSESSSFGGTSNGGGESGASRTKSQIIGPPVMAHTDGWVFKKGRVPSPTMRDPRFRGLRQNALLDKLP